MNLEDLIIKIDIALTGRSEHEAKSTASRQRHLIEDPALFSEISDAYYLSDGGYSRILWNHYGETAGEYGQFSLSSVSTEKAKDKWHNDPDVQNLKKEIQGLVESAIKGYNPSLS